ncbi:SUMF1/EgtB/PvdO family nonheme iron enzyme [Paludibacter sp. 221]|uniref:SUMF1/EgtB/PvdO family nonheme iron enzyme n=1 Tax=Paludibacter sp. 221 TaxID=2302939 RepID=UPI00351B1688
MVRVDGGTFTIGEKTEFVTAPRNSQRRRVTVSSFYMDQYEVTNLEWRDYAHWMEVVFGKTAPKLVEKAQPNKETWREELAYNEPYLNYYFTHPAYDNYPIVGITWEQAMDFCTWRTDRVNEQALVDAGVILSSDFKSLANLSYEEVRDNFVFNTQKYLLQSSYQPAQGSRPKNDLYGNARKVTMSDGILMPDFRLPTEAEWEYAAYAIKASSDGFVEEGRMYPWGGSQMRSSNKKNMGQMQANFVRGRGDMMGTAGSLNDKATIPAPVNSYYPNDLGLFNMAGNVNEWVLDVYRSTSFEDVAEYNSFRGNVYVEPVVASRDALGNPTYQLDSLGRIKNQPTAGGDVRNVKDGDAPSQIFTDYSLQAYFEGAENLGERSDVAMDITDILAPKITDKTRVYKGGSWKDRAYWLNPSTRRYLDQDQSANDIGFRCAMSMIGDSEPPVKK